MRNFEFPLGTLNKGISNKDDNSIIDNGFFADAQNIVYDNEGYAQKRPSVVSGTDAATEWTTGEDVYTKKLYTYQRRDGSKFLIAHTGTKLLWSTNSSTWNTFYTGLNANYPVSFQTFKNNLIISNGLDDAMYWDGTMTEACKIGAPVATLSSAGLTTPGVHSFKVTYTYAVGGTRYAYNAVTTISTTTNEIIELSKIPLSPDGVAEVEVWASLTTDAAQFFKVGTITNATQVMTFNISDATLAAREAYPVGGLAPVDVQFPKGRYLELFENKLFIGHTIAGSSEIRWTDPENFEDVPDLNVLAVNGDDGEYIVGLKFYKAGNQLLVFKKSGLYNVFGVSDTYDYRSVSQNGCTLDGSIQEFHIEDEHSTRESIIYANDTGVWEYTGHSSKIISEQPNGNDVSGIWKNVRQRQVDFGKNIKTSQGDWEGGDITRPFADGKSNWAAVADGTLSIENVLNWKATGITDNFTCVCYDNVAKKLYGIVPETGNASYGFLISYTWLQNLKTWGNRVLLTPSAIVRAGTVVKMVYDAITGRIYGIGKDGYLWKTDSPITTILTGSSNTLFISGGTEGKIVPPKNANFALRILLESSVWRAFTFCGSLKYSQERDSSAFLTNDLSPMFMGVYPAYVKKDDYFYVSEYQEVFNDGATTVFLKNATYIDGLIPKASLDGTADYTLLPHTSQYVKPGLYCAWTYITYAAGATPPFTYPVMSIYTKRPINYQLEAISGYLYTTAISNETIGLATYSKKIIKQINLAAWTQTTFGGAISYGYMFLGTNGTDLYTSYTNVVTGSVLAHGYLAKNATTPFEDKTDRFIKAFAVSLESLCGYEYVINTGLNKLFKMKLSTGLKTIEILTVYPDMGVNKSLSVYRNPDKELFYFINNDGKVYEYGTVLKDLDMGSDITGFKAITAVPGIANDTTGGTTAGFHKYKMTFTYNGDDYIFKGSLTSYSDGKDVLLTGIPLTAVAYTDRAIWVSFANTEDDVYYKLNDANIADGVATATFSDVDADVDGWTPLVENEFLACQTYYDACFISGLNLGAGNPSMFIPTTGAGFAEYRGVAGNYSLYGNWILTDGNQIDTTENSASLISFEAEDTRNVDTEIKYNLATDSNGTLDYGISGDWVEVISGEQPLELKASSVNGNVLSLFGASRYVHEFIELNYNVNARLVDSATTSWSPAFVDAIVLNWVNIEGGNLPKTNVTSIVYKNAYYFAFCEFDPSATANNTVNNCILVLDRYKRWSIWRAPSIHPASFVAFNNLLMWADCAITADGSVESNYNFALAERTSANTGTQFADVYYDVNTLAIATIPIDAFYVTKNYSVFAQYDSPSQKKMIRRLWIDTLKYNQTGAYNLEVSHRVDEAKTVAGIDLWTLHYVDCSGTAEGKKTTRIDFQNAATSLGYRHQFKIRNAVIGQDLAILRITALGNIFHRR